MLSPGLEPARVVWPWVVALMVLAACLRLIHIQADPFWRNELFTIYWVRHGFDFLLGQGMFIETNPPLHFVLLKLWFGLFGDSEFSARLPSTIASVACLPVVYRLGREMAGISVGLVAAALMAASPIQIYFADEARAYALMPLLVASMMLGLCLFLRGSRVGMARPIPASATGAAPAAPAMVRGLLLYGVAATALLYTHGTAVFVVGALAATMALLFADSRLDRARWRGFISVHIVIFVLTLPALLAMAHQAGSSNLEWMPPFSLVQLMLTARFLLVGPLVRDDLGPFWDHAVVLSELGFACCCAICLFAVARKEIRSGAQRAMLLMFPLLFMVVICGVSLGRPLLVPRVTLWLSVPITLTAATVMVSHARLGLRLLAILPLMVCTCLGFWDNSVNSTEHKPDWSAFLADLPGLAGAHPLLVAAPHASVLGITYYRPPGFSAALLQWQPTGQVDRTSTGFLADEVTHVRSIDTTALAELIREGGHPVVYLDVGDSDLMADVSDLPGFEKATRREYPGLTGFFF